MKYYKVLMTRESSGFTKKTFNIIMSQESLDQLIGRTIRHHGIPFDMMLSSGQKEYLWDNNESTYKTEITIHYKEASSFEVQEFQRKKAEGKAYQEGTVVEVTKPPEVIPEKLQAFITAEVVSKVS